MADSPNPSPEQWVQYLRYLRHWGVEQLPRPRLEPAEEPPSVPSASPPPRRGQTSAPPAPAPPAKELAVASTVPKQSPASSSGQPQQLSLLGSPAATGSDDPFWQEPPLPPEQRQQALDELAAEIARCTRCPEPVATRTQTVPGVGNPNARLCFLGEAPGADEDRLGEPFVGRAGQLLNRIIQACGMRREDVYIFNVLKCRPPGNRTPTEVEAANCWPFLLRQIQIIRPEFICCLGAVAARRLLNTKAPMGRLRGQVHDFHGIKVVVTYHPAYLLRNPSAKRQTWEDMKLLLREMGLPVPQQEGN